MQHPTALPRNLARRVGAVVHDELARESAIAFAVRGIAATLAFLFSVILARAIGAQGMGNYYLALTVAGVATVVGRLGLDNAVLRLVSAAHRQGDYGRIAAIGRRSTRLVVAASMGLSVSIFAGSEWLAMTIFNNPHLSSPIQLVALAIVPMSLFNLYAQLLFAIRATWSATVVQALALPICSLGLIPLVWKWPAAPTAIGIYLASAGVTAALGYAAWRKAMRANKVASAEMGWGELMAASTPLFWASLMNLIMGSADTIMLGIWRTPEDVGIYNAALRVTMLSSMLLIAVNSVLAPRFSAAWASQDHGELAKLLSVSTRSMAFVAIVLLVCALALSQIIMLAFGSEFARGTATFGVLATGQFVALATGPVATLLIMTGHDRFHRNTVAVSLMANIGLNALLIPHYGIVGAAVATTIALAVKNVLGVYFVHRKLGINALGSVSGR